MNEREHLTGFDLTRFAQFSFERLCGSTPYNITSPRTCSRGCTTNQEEDKYSGVTTTGRFEFQSEPQQAQLARYISFIGAVDSLNGKPNLRVENTGESFNTSQQDE